MQTNQLSDTQNQDIIPGRNSVSEALSSGRPIEHLLVAKGARTGSALALIARARERGIPVKEVDPRKLTALAGNDAHQGIAAVAAAYPYAELEDLFDLAKKRGEPPFLLVANELEDPHNLGAIIRTAEAVGVHGLIIPKRRTAGLTSSVYKAASGALEYVPVARVSNITAAIVQLKERGVWVYAADMEGTPWCKTDLTGPLALVIGSEGRGVSRLVREHCDFAVSLPMRGQINSLNASVAAGVLLYEIARQRLGLSAR